MTQMTTVECGRRGGREMKGKTPAISFVSLGSKVGSLLARETQVGYINIFFKQVKNRNLKGHQLDLHFTNS